MEAVGITVKGDMQLLLFLGYIIGRNIVKSNQISNINTSSVNENKKFSASKFLNTNMIGVTMKF
jgi:hypothetical protein